MDIRGSVRGLVDNARSFGVGAAFRYLEYRALNKILPIRIFKGMTAVLEDVDRTLFDSGGFAVRIASGDELRAAAAEPEWAKEMPRAFVDQALARGDDCVGIFDGKKLVSIGWYSRTPTPISPSLTLHFDAAWTYMYKGFTLKSHRGKRLHGIGMTFALKHYTDHGARGLISYVEFDNLMSLRSVERMGYRLFGDIYIARIGGRERFFSTPGCRRYAFYLTGGEGSDA
ncbi:MAG: GNAT family N-acetyltransferase [Polyangia bacterium]